MRFPSARSALGVLAGLVVLSCTDSPISPRRIAPNGAAFDGSSASAGRIVISQIYGGGGNSGGVYKNDFVELFNAGGSDVDITGWSIQYASSGSTGSFGSGSGNTGLTPLTGTIPAGGYYLVQEAAGTGAQPLLPTADVTGAIAMSATNARVVLYKTSVAISAPCPVATDPNVVDLVAYGSNTATCTPQLVAPTLANGTAAIRVNGGCPSTATPAVDFPSPALAPTPRNSASPKNVCPGMGTTTTPPPPSVASIAITGPTSMVLGGANATFTVQNVIGTDNNPITPIPQVTWAPSPTGIIDINPTTGVATVVGIGANPPTHVSITASIGTVVSNAIDVTVTAPVQLPDLTGKVLISQIYGAGGNNGSVLKNDYVELFNPGTDPINLAGWSVQQISANGTGTWAVSPLTGIIPPKHFYLVKEVAQGGGSIDLPASDDQGTLALGAGSGKILLSQTSTAQTGACPTGNAIVDVVAYGSGNCGNPTPAPGTTTAVFRQNGGCLNTKDPSFDFVVLATNPRNSSLSSTCDVGPLDRVSLSGLSTVLAGSSISLTATAFDAKGYVIIPATFAWSTSDAAIATVSNTGSVTGVQGNGTPATISASTTINGVAKSGSLDVTVGNPGGINWLDISYSADSMPPGFQAQIFLTAREAKAGTIIPATFAVEALDPSIATVLSTPAGWLVQGVAAPSVPGTRPRFKITATPTAVGGAAYVFTTGASTSLPIEAGTAAPASTYAQNDEFGRPSSAGTDQNDYLITRNEYTLSYNMSRGTPNWVSYELDRRQRPGTVDRCNCFTADPLLVPFGKQIYTTDYTGGGFDRGHMTRSADRTAAQMDNADTFILTNVVPQTAELNEATWAHFENILGDSADAGRAVYITTGPLYQGALRYVNDAGKVAIPDATWKVALIGPMNGTAFTASSIQTWDDLTHLSVLAVNMPNTSTIADLKNPDLNDWKKYLTSVPSIEAATGLHFLAKLRDDFRAALEAGDHAPVARFAMSGVANEGSSLTFDASTSSDADLGRTDMTKTEALTFTWHFSDGTTLSGKSVAKTFADNGSFTASLTVTDAYGWESTTMQTVTVANLAPTATFVMPSPLPTTEGATFTLSLADAADASAIDGSQLTFAFDCGAGVYGPATASASATCLVQDNGDATVRAKVIDKDGGATEYTGSFSTANVAPTAVFAVPATGVTEGVHFTLALTSATDPSPADAAHLTFAFDCGKGYGTAGATASASCVVDDNGDVSVRGKVLDKDGGSSEYTATVHVANTPPTATFTAPSSVNEGSSFTLNAGNVVDASTADAEAGFTFAFDCGTGFGAPGAATTATCATTIYGTRTVRLRVTDKDGGFTDYSSIVQVLDVAPIVGALRDSTMLQGETFSQTDSFVDPGTNPWAVTATYGDGSAAQTLSLNGKSFTLSHRYDAAGSFTASVTVNDGQLSNSRGASVVVQTPSQGVDNLDNAVDNLAALLSDSDLKQLHGKLDNARDQIAKSNIRPASNQLDEFIKDLQKDVSDGKVSATGAAPVIAYAQRVIASLNR